MKREEAVDALNTLLPDFTWKQAEEWFAKQKKDDLHELEREADNMAAACAQISSYLQARYTAGCGDAGHEAAIVKAMAARKKVRKALGYNVP